MGQFLSNLGRNLFGVALLLNMLWATALCKFTSMLPLSKSTREGLSLTAVQLAWRMALFFSPWVRMKGADDFAAACAQLSADVEAMDALRAAGKPARPIFILGNHTSFLDTLLTVVQIPTALIKRTRTYMGAHLFKLPLLSTCCRACGHFPVHFTSSEDGKFTVDREKMEETQAKVDVHIDHGGLLCFFPEGQINKNPDTLMSFRYGGMVKALQKDAILWSFTTHGNPGIWGAREQLGGHPGTARFALRRVAPKGSGALVGELRKLEKKSNQSSKDRPDAALLGEHCRDAMQRDYDELKALVDGKKTD